jgi:starch phosphorylase
MLHDPERLTRILTNQQYPVQLVLAGKAHPADRAGKDMIRGWIHFLRRYDIRQHAVFLTDYDLLPPSGSSRASTSGLTRRAVHGRRAARAG